MRKLLLLSIAIVAMVGVSNAQCTVKCTQPNTACDPNVDECVNLLTDPLNCGAIGHQCDGGDFCDQGECVIGCGLGHPCDFPPPPCFADKSINTQAKRARYKLPTRLKPLPIKL